MSYIGAEPDGMGKAQRFTFTASGSETVVSADDDGIPIGYTAGQVSVFLNGVKLVVGTGKDCQATNGSTITGLSALSANDVIEVVALSIFSATTVEGTALISTGQTGGTKFLREDGDGTASWQTATDATKAPLASPTFTGVATAPSLILTPSSAPSSPSEGQIYYNNSDDTILFYNGSAWSLLSNATFTATGGTITEYTGFKVHTFLTSGTFTAGIDGTVDYLVVAGGGGGGRESYSSGTGGGGGAGGVLTSANLTMPAGAYTINVGGGGTGYSGSTGAQGGDGDPSSIVAAASQTFTTIATIGGGGGGGGASSASAHALAAGRTGGSGGGAANAYIVSGNANYPGGQGTAGQGNDGGHYTLGSNSTSKAGGGGGASADGGSGDGGAGITNLYRTGVSGTTAGIHTFGGGGGGSAEINRHPSSPPYAGGLGGGGNGAIHTHAQATVGVQYSGGGGGGSANHSGQPTSNAKAGGSGIVIIRYAV
jgi:hypothetical protein